MYIKRFESLVTMLIFSILFLLLSNAVTLRRDKSILFSRVSIIILLYSALLAKNSLYIPSIDGGIGLYSGLFHMTSITQVFHIFIFLVSTSDLVSIFLSIELQSYGLYLLSTLYRNSELATSGGLTYFLLGGLSSCFILLGTSILYSNSGLTNLDSLYVITSLSDITNNDNILY